MRNPLDHVSGDFWKVTGDLDNVVRVLPEPGPGQRINPITGQLVAIREIDIQEIRKVADEKWGNPDREGSLRHAAESAALAIDSVGSYISEGWDGQDFIAFRTQLDSLKDAIHKLVSPAEEMSKALEQLAKALETTITETITTIAGFGGVISALAGVAGSLAIFPDITVTKIAALIAAILTAIFSVIGLANAIMKGVEQRQTAVDGVVRECTELLGVLK